jgi:hypothetical protein
MVSNSKQSTIRCWSQLHSPKLRLRANKHFSPFSKAEISTPSANSNLSYEGSASIPDFYAVSTARVDVTINIAFDAIWKSF